MGNKIGLEITKQQIKLVIADNDSHRITFLRNLQINCYRSEMKCKQYTLFIFLSPIKDIYCMDIKHLRGQISQHYETGIAHEKINLQSNIESINIFDRNLKLKNFLEALLGSQLNLQYHQKTSSSIEMVNFFQLENQFYTFSQNFKITQLNNFETLTPSKKTLLKNCPQKYLMVSLKNGLSSYYVEKEQTVKRLYGSIIGQKTVLNVLKLKFPNKTTSELLKTVFTKGKLQNTSLLVEDIYGEGVDKLGLPGDLVASNLAKLSKMGPKQMEKLSQDDITRAMLTALAINTGIHISLNLGKEKLHYAFILTYQLHICEDFYRMVQSVVDQFAPDCEVFFSEHAPFLSCINKALTAHQ